MWQLFSLESIRTAGLFNQPLSIILRKEVNMNLSVEPIYTLEGLDIADLGCSNCVQPLGRAPVPVRYSHQQLEGISDITSSWWFWGGVGLAVGAATYLILTMLTKKKKEE
jgi:hypothetical protein